MSQKHNSESKNIEENEVPSDYEPVSGDDVSQLENSDNESTSEILPKSSSGSSKKKKKDKKKKKKKKERSKTKDKKKKAKKTHVSDNEDEEEEAKASDTDTRSNSSNSIQKPTKLNKSEHLELIRDIPEDDQTPSQKNYCNLFNVVNTLEKLTKDAKFSMHIAEKEAINDYRKGLKKEGRSTTQRRQTGFSQPYDVPESLKKILDSSDFEDYVVEATPSSGYNAYDKEADKPKITSSQLVDACRHYFIARDGKENKGLVSFEDDSTPVYSIFSEYLEQLDAGQLEKNFKPNQRSQDADRGSLSRIQMISFACAYLKWVNVD